jgi:plasmid stabilization system protein ParE
MSVAARFQTAVESTLEEISLNPGLRPVGRFKHPQLRGLRSMRVDPPFIRLLIFYRYDGSMLEAWRLMHGARDLRHRLVEPPELP